jgi:hypothetical protein
VDSEGLPTKKQLIEELSKLTRRGLGRSLPGVQSESDVWGLSEISRELAEKSSEDWPLRIARVVIPEVRSIEPLEDRLALADVLAIDLERPLEEILALGEPVEPLEPSGPHVGRYVRAAERYKPALTERNFKERRRPVLLERLSERLLSEVERRREEIGRDEPDPAPIERKSAAPAVDAEPPTVQVGVVGVLFTLIGIAWLVAVATGAIS